MGGPGIEAGTEGGLARADEAALWRVPGIQESRTPAPTGPGCSEFTALAGSFPGRRRTLSPRVDPTSPLSSKSVSVAKNERRPHLSADSFENP